MCHVHVEHKHITVTGFFSITKITTNCVHLLRAGKPAIVYWFSLFMSILIARLGSMFKVIEAIDTFLIACKEERGILRHRRECVKHSSNFNNYS